MKFTFKDLIDFGPLQDVILAGEKYIVEHFLDWAEKAANRTETDADNKALAEFLRTVAKRADEIAAMAETPKGIDGETA